MHTTKLAGISVAALVGCFVLQAREARAESPPQEDAIGTRPAAPQQAAAATPAAEALLDVRGGDGPDMPGEGRLKVAGEPATDWAVLHAGFRPHLGTFYGIGTFALAHERTERFFGITSFSLVRNDAGTHGGALQIAIGRNLADSFAGGFQVSVTENRARFFDGVAQLTLAYNRSIQFRGFGQIAAYNRARDFSGALQLGGFNRADGDFAGFGQLGLLNRARDDFSGVLQLGLVNGSGSKMFNEGDQPRGDFFKGLAQVGLVNSNDGHFYGLGQFGLGSISAGEFAGLAEVGVFYTRAEKFRGLAQIGSAVVDKKGAGAQIGLVAISEHEHDGLQLGAAVNVADKVRGAQVGVVNVADEARGIQIGVFNHTKTLRGVQIGLANHAEDGLLAWSALLNMGFGDDDGGNGSDRSARAERRQLVAE